MTLVQTFTNNLINNRLLKWSLFFILSYCTLVIGELEPKDEEETKPTMVKFLIFVFILSIL